MNNEWLFQTTLKLLNGSAFFYLGASIAFFFAISTAGTRNLGRWSTVGTWLLNIAFVAHTGGLLGRWIIGGISRPPWTNLYESLIFFAWGVALLGVYAIRSWRLPLVNAIALPLVFILMGMSVMTPNKAVEPLIPALQSYWLKIHVIFGMIAYSGFTMAACFGFLQMFKNKVSVSRIGSGLSLMILLNLGIAGGNEMFKTGHFYMARTVERTAPDGNVVKVKDTYRDEATGKPVTRMERVPGARWFFYGAVLSFLGAAVLLWTRRKSGAANDWAGWGPRLFASGLLFIFGLIGAVGWGVAHHPELTLYSNPYLSVLIVMTVFMAVMYLVMVWKYDAFVQSLPSQQRLEELEYKNILFSFPFQTLLLITGAIWAYYAWGRSWGWDPKETWALITWFAFLIYLHGKLLLRWSPNWLSVLAIVGFVIMVFAFLGVNLVLSGLHSYGAA